ncbi:hypothetical protein CEXT_219421 [Caerostris extrusa]|uniref:Uncharacterized protein n=1 Tax=Caerostris extrusa TaxID=172846 RepID=A0AAV4WMU7_CAEEX|nr:hypothetical protein CEXT_219421 [Caerostris extrusa]
MQLLFGRTFISQTEWLFMDYFKSLQDDVASGMATDRGHYRLTSAERFLPPAGRKVTRTLAIIKYLGNSEGGHNSSSYC